MTSHDHICQRESLGERVEKAIATESHQDSDELVTRWVGERFAIKADHVVAKETT